MQADAVGSARTMARETLPSPPRPLGERRGESGLSTAFRDLKDFNMATALVSGAQTGMRAGGDEATIPAR
jgi:hypothetical protein